MTNANGLSVIGYFLWWSVNSVKILRNAFAALLRECDIDYDMGDDAEHIVSLRRAAFLKAVREVKMGNKKFLVRKILKNKDNYIFGLVDESVDTKDTNLSYYHSATMTFVPETGDLTCDFDHRAFHAIKERYEEYKDHMNSDDVRAVLLQIISQYHRVGVRRRGGIYFVPEDYKVQVGKVEKLLEMLDASSEGECYLAVAPQIDVESSKRAIYKAFMAGLRDKIASFNEEFDKGSMTRKSSWEKRIVEYKDLRDEIDFYADRLSFQAEDLKDQLKNLGDKVRAKIAK